MYLARVDGAASPLTNEVQAMCSGFWHLLAHPPCWNQATIARTFPSLLKCGFRWLFKYRWRSGKVQGGEQWKYMGGWSLSCLPEYVSQMPLLGSQAAGSSPECKWHQASERRCTLEEHRGCQWWMVGFPICSYRRLIWWYLPLQRREDTMCWRNYFL